MSGVSQAASPGIGDDVVRVPACWNQARLAAGVAFVLQPAAAHCLGGNRVLGHADCVEGCKVRGCVCGCVWLWLRVAVAVAVAVSMSGYACVCVSPHEPSPDSPCSPAVCLKARTRSCCTVWGGVRFVSCTAWCGVGCGGSAVVPCGWHASCPEATTRCFLSQRAGVSRRASPVRCRRVQRAGIHGRRATALTRAATAVLYQATSR